MSLPSQYESFREGLESDISASIEALDEDLLLTFARHLLGEKFSECNTYDGQHFQCAEFEDSLLAKLADIIADIQNQKEEAKSGSKAHAVVSNMFGDMTKSMDGLTVRAYPDPTWEKIMGRHINKKA